MLVKIIAASAAPETPDALEGKPQPSSIAMNTGRSTTHNPDTEQRSEDSASVGPIAGTACPVKDPGATGVAMIAARWYPPHSQSAAWQAALCAPERFLVQRKLHRQVLYVPGGDECAGVYLKVFTPTKGVMRKLSRLLPIQAAREYVVCRLLRRFGVSTPLPLAVAGCLGPARASGSVFASREVAPATTLAAALRRLPQQSEERAGLLEMYGRLLARVLRAGFYPADFYCDNVLLEHRGESGHEPVLIDHEATRPLVGFLARWREKALVAALYSDANPPLSDLDRRHFYRAYLTELTRAEPDSRAVARLEERTNRRRGLVLARRARRNAAAPFKRRERFSGFTLQRRRDINGTLLVEAWAQCENERPPADDPLPLQKTLRVMDRTVRVTLLRPVPARDRLAELLYPRERRQTAAGGHLLGWIRKSRFSSLLLVFDEVSPPEAADPLTGAEQ